MPDNAYCRMDSFCILRQSFRGKLKLSAESGHQWHQLLEYMWQSCGLKLFRCILQQSVKKVRIYLYHLRKEYLLESYFFFNDEISGDADASECDGVTGDKPSPWWLRWLLKPVNVRSPSSPIPTDTEWMCPGSNWRRPSARPAIGIRHLWDGDDFTGQWWSMLSQAEGRFGRPTYRYQTSCTSMRGLPMSTSKGTM